MSLTGCDEFKTKPGPVDVKTVVTVPGTIPPQVVPVPRPPKVSG